VEFAGALRELITHVLPHDFPGLDFGQSRVLLVEAADRLLLAFSKRLGRYALKTLRAKGVDVRLGTGVESLHGEVLTFHGGHQIRSATVMWAAGVRAADLAKSLGVRQARGGRIPVTPGLQVEGHPEVYAIGDIAAVEQDGVTLPMLAPVAIQEGRRAAENIGRALAGLPAEPFRYHDRGVMATIGRSAAVAQIGRIGVTGFPAWIMWLALHIVTLIGFRNRVLVLVNWIWNYLSYDRAVRLILGSDPIHGNRGDDSH
jgi:NADH dehydrogenase